MSEVSVDEAHRRVTGGWAVLVDVRETDEFDAGHAAGAVSKPLSALVPEGLPMGVDVFMICRSGGRSAKAVQKAHQGGVTAYNVTGGTAAWFQAGLPMSATGPGSPKVI